MRFLRSGIGAHLVLAGVLTASHAFAQAGDRAVADALFEKGRAAMGAQDYATACASFEESNRLDPAPGTMANLAECEDHRAHLASALEWYQRAASKLPEGDERRTIAERRAAEIKARMPMLTIRLAPGTPPSARVMRDTTEFRSVSLGLPLPIDPGPHQVVVSAPGYPDARYPIELQEKELKEIVVGVGTNQPAAPPPPGAAYPPQGAPPPPPAADTGAPASKGDHKTLGFVLLGVGGVGVGTALVLGGVALGKKSTVKDHCQTSTHTCDSQDAVDAASSGKTLTTVSTVSFLVGAAAGGLGLYFVLSSKSEPSTTVGTAALPGGGMFRVGHEF